MNDTTLDYETIFNNMGGTLTTEDGLYLESSSALGNMIYAYPNLCGRAEVELVKMSLSQLVNEDERVLTIKRNTTKCAIIFAVVLTVASFILAVRLNNIWIFRFVFYFWICAYLNGFYKKSAKYYGSIMANWSMAESKKYNYAFSQVLNSAREKKEIPTYKEAVKASPYLDEVEVKRLAESLSCVFRSVADALVLLAVSTCINMTWQGNNSMVFGILITIVFLFAGAVLMTLHKDLIWDFFYSHRKAKIFMAMAEKPLMSKPNYKHYDTAISALIAYCIRERYIAEHSDEYLIAYSVVDLSEEKLYITLKNGDVVVIYL